MGHFQSYIRLLPVRLEEARGHIAESTWGRFLWLAGRLRSRFPDLNEPDKLLRAVLFTSAQRTMVDSLYQLFKAPSPGPVSGAWAAGGVSSAAVPLSSASVFLVVPVSVGPSFSGSGSASVIEVGDSDLAASDTGIPVSSVSRGSSVVPASVGPLFSGSSSASVIEVGDSNLEISDTGFPVSGVSRSKRTRHGRRRRVVGGATPAGVLVPLL